MRVDFCEMNVGSEMFYINPSRVCYFSSQGNGITRIFFDGAQTLDVKASPADVRKKIAIADGLHVTPVGAI